MKKKIILILTSFGIVTYAIGCGSIANAKTQHVTNFYLEEVGSSRNVHEYRDNETGVHYLIYSETRIGNVSYSGICPRYNADGTLYVD